MTFSDSTRAAGASQSTLPNMQSPVPARTSLEDTIILQENLDFNDMTSLEEHQAEEVYERKDPYWSKLEADNFQYQFDIPLLPNARVNQYY